MDEFPVPCLVIGANGMLGRDLCSAMRLAQIQIVEMDVNEIDISNKPSVSDVFRKAKPLTVINLAAVTDVDGCESRQDLALSVNGVGAENLAMASREFGSFLIHISTDYVFDGSSDKPYLEGDSPHPLGVYGKTKLEGEIRIRNSLPENHLIVRTQWLYGQHGKNFVDTIIRAAKQNNKLRIVNDQHGAPTYTVDLAEAIIELGRRRFSGIFHVTNSGSTTWSGFASKILGIAGVTDVEIEEINTEELGRPAPRPLYSVLDTSKFETLTGMKLRSWEDALQEYLSRRNF
ncbi:MAG: dTDP-4-dehydrorhamnose reductase [Pseudomonadota bacterium]